MISSQHLKEELIALDNVHKSSFDDGVTLKGILKSNILMIKLLANIRTNQALGLQSSGVDLVPRRIESEGNAD